MRFPPRLFFQSRWHARVISCCLVAATGSVANAQRPLSDYSFSLRFPAANSSFASYADVAAMGGAQAASEWSSSLNPASAASPHPERTSANAFSPQFSTVRFAEGARLDVLAEALTVDAGAWGILIPAAAQVRSNHASTRQGLGFEFEADLFQLQWSKLADRDWTVGALFGVTRSETRFDSSGLDVARSRGEAYTSRVGAVYRALPTLKLGLTLEYALSPARSRSLAFDPATASFAAIRSTDTTKQFLVRTGLTWDYAKGSALYLDYHGGFFRNRDGTLWVHRIPIGIEHMFVRDIFWGRIGTTVDSRGSVSLTSGLGLTLGKSCSLDLAFQRNNFSEVREEFGMSRTFVVSLGFVF